MNKLFLLIGVLALAGVGCAQVPHPSKVDTTPSSTTSEEIIYATRAANAARYMSDKNFVSFMRDLQPSVCKNKTPNVSSIFEADLTGDGQKELIIDATSCQTYSSGSDMDLVARVNKNGTYSVLKINGQKLIGYYSTLEVQNNMLVQEHAVHMPDDTLAGPTGGVDLAYLVWNGSQFVTQKIVHAATWLQPKE